MQFSASIFDVFITCINIKERINKQQNIKPVSAPFLGVKEGRPLRSEDLVRAQDAVGHQHRQRHRIQDRTAAAQTSDSGTETLSWPVRYHPAGILLTRGFHLP